MVNWDDGWILSYQRLIGLLFNDIHRRRGYRPFVYTEAHKCVKRFLNVIHDDLPFEYVSDSIKMRRHISAMKMYFNPNAYRSMHEGAYIDEMRNFYYNERNYTRVSESVEICQNLEENNELLVLN